MHSRRCRLSLYETPAALRSALEAHLASNSRESGTYLQLLRRLATFERLLARLELAAPDRWIVKGGMALEVRIGDKARSTRDLDLALRDAGTEGTHVREFLSDCVATDREGDGFEFRVGAPTSLSADEAGRPGWRFSVEARMGNRTFAEFRLDVVARAEEISKTQRVRLPGLLAFAGLKTQEVEVVDPAKHFAEKLHAFTRFYGERPNSRVRDLPDLVLLIEEGLEPNAELLAVVSHVFRERATHGLPMELSYPPASWTDPYPTLASGLDIGAKTIEEAMAQLRPFWAATLANRNEED